MSGEMVAAGATAALLVAAVFAPPAWLLLMGHRIRYRTVRTRGAFWGGVAGYVGGALLLPCLLLREPLVWPPPEGIWIVPAALVVPTVAGMALGAVVGRRPSGPKLGPRTAAPPRPEPRSNPSAADGYAHPEAHPVLPDPRTRR